MNNERNVGAFFYARKLRRQDQEKGITLIALVITIIVMLVLVAVTISMAVNGGLFGYAGKAGAETNEAIDVEQTLASGAVEVDGVWYDSIDDYINNKPGFNAKYWDKKAAPEDVFIWQSDDPNDEGYGVVVGYRTNLDNYPTLRFPSRCTKILVDNSYITGTTEEMSQIRSYTKNIKEIEIPRTVVELGNFSKAVYNFAKLEKVVIPGSVVSIDAHAFDNCTSLTTIIIEEGVMSIGEMAFAFCNINIVIPDTVTSVGEDAFLAVPHIEYHGSASGEPWGARSMN